jgi:hypothetical protein
MEKIKIITDKTEVFFYILKKISDNITVIYFDNR